MMHREEFERKRRDDFLEKMKHLYEGKNGTEPELQAVIIKNRYTTKLARKLYELLMIEKIDIRKEIFHKLNGLEINIRREILLKLNDLFENK